MMLVLHHITEAIVGPCSNNLTKNRNAISALHFAAHYYPNVINMQDAIIKTSYSVLLRETDNKVNVIQFV